MVTNRPRALVLGCNGGVGRAVLALLEHSAPGRKLLESLDTLVLLDREASDQHVPPQIGKFLPATVKSSRDLGQIVAKHGITQVIDVSSIDTVDCTQTCEQLGADFLCTSVEEWPGGKPLATDEAIARLLPPRRPILQRQSHLVGSGANPGIVNALALTALVEFGKRAGVAPTIDALDLASILITEEDTTVEEGIFRSSDVFAMTWSPIHCLEELLEPAAFAAREGRIVSLGHQPTDRLYHARCGDRNIDGMAVPHEEIATLARRFSTVEIGFIYRIPTAAREPLAAHPYKRSPQAWRTHRLYPPWARRLTGRDRIGVLLCSRRFGELWMGFDTDMEVGLGIGTNATLLQVAAGVVAGWTQLGVKKGIHFVEDLDPHEFLRVTSEVLGPPVVIHDASAAPQSLADREVTETAQL